MVPVLMELTGQPEPEGDGARMVIQGQETPVFKVAATRDARTFMGANSSYPSDEWLSGGGGQSTVQACSCGAHSRQRFLPTQ